jgi:hypothetical protein
MYLRRDKMTRLTEEQINTIKELYPKGVVVTEIAKHAGCSTYAVSHYAEKAGYELRRPKKSKFKKCPNCKRTIELKGARYCPFCATDIRDEKEIALERLNKLNGLLRSFPTNMADEATAIINDVVEYIKTVK